MTDRFHSLIVVLDKDIRDDDAELLINAIKQLKRVISVKGMVSSPTEYMAVARAKHELSMKIIGLLKND